MRIDQNQIDSIKSQFRAIQCKEDFVNLLSDAKNLLYGEKCLPIPLKYLTYFADPKKSKNRYSTFLIKKKSGGNRTIHAPSKGLKSILRPLNLILQCLYEPDEVVTGFVLGRSIVDNAKNHVGHHYVYNLDLKDFFHSFDRKRVKYGFMIDPFFLGPEKEKEEIAFLLASLCTHPLEVNGEYKTILPQGSPTSPTITNLLCRKLDNRLSGLANRFGATYSRYADDITFSSNHNIYKNEDFLNELKRIIEDDQNLAINPKKTRLQKSGFRQETTGLVVNQKVNVRRGFVKQIRTYLHLWEKYGYEKAENIFRPQYLSDKGYVKKGIPHLQSVLSGKLDFLKMVKGEEDGTYLGLKERFDKLVGHSDPINKILDIWEKEGIEKAMHLFYLNNQE